MAKGINRVTLVGNVGKPPAARTGQSATVVKMSVATGESWKNQQGEKVERTEWHQCVAFGKVGDIIMGYINQGDKVYVCGKLRTRKYEDNQNQTRYITEVHVDDILKLSGEMKQPPAQQQPPQPQPPAAQPSQPWDNPPSRAAATDPIDDDVPF